jgi:hypothetical protein
LSGFARLRVIGGLGNFRDPLWAFKFGDPHRRLPLMNFMDVLHNNRD